MDGWVTHDEGRVCGQEEVAETKVIGEGIEVPVEILGHRDIGLLLFVALDGVDLLEDEEVSGKGHQHASGLSCDDHHDENDQHEHCPSRSLQEVLVDFAADVGLIHLSSGRLGILLLGLLLFRKLR